MKISRPLAALWVAVTLSLPGLVQAQPQGGPPPENVLHLSASGFVEVQQDLLGMTLSTTREGADAAAVQNQLKAVLDAALTEARRSAQPGQLDVRTDNFSLYPRHNREGRLSGWTGSAELILEGRDFARIAQVAGRIPGMTVAGVQFSLSREQRSRVEGEAQLMAIERFRTRAAELARGFGFGNYSLREVTVQSGEPGFQPRPRTMAFEAKAAGMADAPVPVEAGRSTVTVTVSGSVQLR